MNLLTISVPLLSGLLAQPEPEPAVAPPEPTRRVLVDRSLAQRDVQLLALGEQSLTIIDAQGRTQNLPRADVLAILPPLPELDAPFVPGPVRRTGRRQGLSLPQVTPQIVGRLELTDGQVLPGTISTSSGKDLVSWNSRLWGSVSLPLDNIASVVIAPERFDALMQDVRNTQDMVLLRNGDRVEGFLVSVDASMVRVERTQGVSELPLARVDGVLLANPVKPIGGAWAWLSGAAAAISAISIDESGSCSITGRLPGAQSQPTATIPADTLEAVCFEAGVLKTLAALPSEVAPVGEARGWSPPPSITMPNAPLGASDIELPGPMRVEWVLPRGVSRLATTLELPPSARLWGDCVVTVESVNSAGAATQIARGPLNQSTPQIPINAALTANAARLRITVDPGPSGPIQDRVVIRRPLLLTAP